MKRPPATKFATLKHPWTGEILEPHMTIKKKICYAEVETLSIADDPLPSRRVSPNKYHSIFNKLKVGQNIRCKPADVNRISNALRVHIQANNIQRKGKPVRIVSQSASPDGIGRVWMIEDTRRLEGVEK